MLKLTPIEMNLSQQKKRKESLLALEMQNLVKYQVFTDIMVSYVPPATSEKIYPCIDCGDKFVVQDSFEFHVNRKTVKIYYNCQVCKTTKIFLNRCNLLRHIRSHVLKTATVKLVDIRIEPLFNSSSTNNELDRNLNSERTSKTLHNNTNGIGKPIEDNSSTQHCSAYNTEDLFCKECNFTFEQPHIYYSRLNHFNPPNISVRSYQCYTCDLCFSTLCALKVHMRLHMKKTPYICLQCGKHASSHDGELPSPVDHPCFYYYKCAFSFCSGCLSIMPENKLAQHLEQQHSKIVFKCPLCCVASFSQQMLGEHCKNKHVNYVLSNDVETYYQCRLCPGRLVPMNKAKLHFNGHAEQCTERRQDWLICLKCRNRYKMKHNIVNHLKTCIGTLHMPVFQPLTLNGTDKPVEESTEKGDLSSETKVQMFKVLKKCTQCSESVQYSCPYNEIVKLPTNCPRCDENMTSKDGSMSDHSSNSSFEIKDGIPAMDEASALVSKLAMITSVNGDVDETIPFIDLNNCVCCKICKMWVTEKWKDLVTHFAQKHKEHKLIDIKVNLERCNIETLKSSTEQNFEDDIMDNLQDNNPILNNDKKQKTSPNDFPKAKRQKKIYPIKGVKSFKDEELFSAGLIVNNNDKDTAEAYNCTKCDYVAMTKTDFKDHIVSHRDVSAAYQCMECALSFVVKPSFAAHLFVSHGITNADKYIDENNCFNEEAIKDPVHNGFGFDPNSNKPLKENQCKICRDEFESDEDLRKHFRVHGMAFLLTRAQTQI